MSGLKIFSFPMPTRHRHRPDGATPRNVGHLALRLMGGEQMAPLFPARLARRGSSPVRARAALFGITATVLAGFCARAGGEPLDSIFSLHGFGTLGAVRSDQDRSDVVSNSFLQPNGAGHTRRWHMGVDSKIGGQLDARFSRRLSAVLQVVSKHRYDNSWTPGLEWANVKYQLTPGLSVRVGRTVAATFAISDTTNVGYANPWIRSPQELYAMLPATRLDGMDLVWNAGAGPVINTFQAAVGSTKFKVVGGDEITANNILAVNDTIEYGALALRVGYRYIDANFDSSRLDRLINGLSGVGDALITAGLPLEGDRAHALARRYDVDDTPLEIFTLGARFDPRDWLLMGEWARMTDAGIIPRADAWYVTGGHRFREVMPYVTVAEVNPKTPSESGIPLAGLPPGPLRGAAGALNSGLDTVLRAAAPSQKSLALGLRWDLLDAAALKFEYQHIRLDDRSTGRFGNLQPGLRPGGDADVFSIALDFVF